MILKTTFLSNIARKYIVFYGLIWLSIWSTHASTLTKNIMEDSSAMAAYCYPPLGVSVGSITSNSAVLSWTAPSVAPAEGYRIYISTVNAYPTQNTPMATTTSTSFLLDGLQPGTLYFYFISSSCTNWDFSVWRSGNFKTLAVIPTQGCLLSDMEFPSTPFSPACTGSLENITTATEAGEHCRINVTAGMQYTFSSSIGTDFITISNAAGSQILASGIGTVLWSSDNFSGMIKYYIHKNTSCGEDEIYRDRNIKCNPVTVIVNPCNAIALTNLNVSQITAGSAYFQWNAPETPIGNYQMYLSVSNTPPTPATEPSYDLQASNSTITGFQYETTYHYWMRANCGGYQGNWISGGSFTTLQAPNCSTTPMGQQPNSIISPMCTGSTFILSNYNFTGYYTTITVQPNTNYTFTSQSNRYLSLRNALGTIYYKQGYAPFTWNSGSASGTMQMLVHSNPSCGTTSSALSASILMSCSNVLAIEEFDWDKKISIFPNPVSDKFNILTGDLIADQIYIFDSLGRKVADIHPTAVDTEVDCSRYSEGIYYVRLTKENNSTVKKIIVKH